MAELRAVADPPPPSISEVTRRAIFDELLADGVSWSGRLGEVEFLSRLFDLSALPSTDPRFKDARGDIWQHRVNNPEDWHVDWVFADERFNLLGCADEEFLRFLVETVHPAVRPDAAEARRLVGRFNEHLRADGWELYEASLASGRPQFADRPATRPALTSAERGFPLDLDDLLASMFGLLRERDAKREMAILAGARARGYQSNYDNWNGGTRSWSIRLGAELGLYASLSDSDRAEAAKVLFETAKPFFEEFPNDLLEQILIVPKTVSSGDWRKSADELLSHGKAASRPEREPEPRVALANAADPPAVLDVVADAEVTALGAVLLDDVLLKFGPEQAASVRAALDALEGSDRIAFKGPKHLELTAGGLFGSRRGPAARALVERLLPYFQTRIANEGTRFLNFSSEALVAEGILGAPSEVGLAVTAIRVLLLGDLRSISDKRVIEWNAPADLPALRAVRTLEEALARAGRLRAPLERAGTAPPRPVSTSPAPDLRGLLAPGALVGPYEIVALLGEGHLRLEREDALKVLLMVGAPNDEARADAAARMLREARAAALVSHPNIVTIYDVAELHGLPYIAMELVRGVPLRHYVGKTDVSHEEKLGWLQSIARALAAAHKVHVVHRDVKPENVMITDEGVAKILDFGIARGAATDTVSGTGKTAAAFVQTLTVERRPIGTPQYMAPEQFGSTPLDGRADQFAWAVVAWELLAGELPWGAVTHDWQLVHQVLTAHVRPLSEVVPGIPPRVSDVVARALTKNRDGRFTSMEDVIAALGQPFLYATPAGVVSASGDAAFARTEQAAALPPSNGLGHATREPASPARFVDPREEPLSTTFERWLAEGRLPTVRVAAGNRQGHWHAPATNRFVMIFSVRNNIPALDLQVSVTAGVSWITVGDVEQGHDVTREVAFDYKSSEALPLARSLILRYATTFGAILEDEFRLTLPREGAIDIKLAARRLLKERSFETR
jgi:serine/threonine protein kinase